MDCLPSRKGHCCNNAPTPTRTPTPTAACTANEGHSPSLSPSADASATINIVGSQEDSIRSAITDASAIFDDVNAEIPGPTAEIRTLPSFKPTSSMDSSWGDLSGEEFTKMIDDAYAQVVHWRPNLFKVPSGACGKQFVVELTRFFNAFASEADLEAIALKSAMTLPSLLLQKPHAKSKAHDHVSCLQRRLSLWEKGDILSLLKEGRALQKSLARSQPPKSNTADDASTARKFSKMMMEGRVRAALKLVSNNSNTGLLSLDEIVDTSRKTVMDVLEEKHPDPKPAYPEALLEEADNDSFHPAIFDNLTAESIRAAALHTQGAAGPSGLDALSWRRLCTAFGQKSNDLCAALAAVARRISTTFIDPSILQAYTSCRLIPLDKHPGVRPIGIGEVVRRIIGKAVMRIVKYDLQDAVGTIQLCAGQDAGCEAAVHAMERIFADEDAEAMILVDASNAFNCLNRQVTLLNCGTICPALSHILINTYRSNSQLFVDGQCIHSKEGTTQGDPLAMAMYAIGTKPLITRLDGIAKQVWYADDSAAGSTLERLRRWWDLLVEIGPLYGYFPNSSKTHVLAKTQHVEAAKEIFKGTGIVILTEGERYPGGALGTSPFVRQYVERKVECWVNEVENLSKFAETQPHAAYAAFTHGLSAKWNYLLRVTDWEENQLNDSLEALEKAIRSRFIPAITGQPPPGDQTREMLALPARLGGMGLMNPAASAKEQRTASRLISAPLVDQIINQDHLLDGCHSVQQSIKRRIQHSKRTKQKEDASNLQRNLPIPLQRSMELSQEKGASTWLTALPIDEHGFALHKAAFRDSLSLRYGWPLQNSPSHCSCGQPFSVEHALTCKTGGFPAVRHNEVRDITATLLTEVCHGVTTEPHLQPLSGESLSHRSAITEDGARLDVAMYGFWGGRFEKAFVDVRVFNPSAQSNRHGPLSSVYRKHEQEKRRQYDQRVREVEHATFTPLVLSTTGGMGRAATTFYKRLSSMVAEKRNVPYAVTLSWIRCRLSFALLRASIMSIRGARSSRHHPATENPIDLQLAESRLN